MINDFADRKFRPAMSRTRKARRWRPAANLSVREVPDLQKSRYDFGLVCSKYGIKPSNSSARSHGLYPLAETMFPLGAGAYSQGHLVITRLTAL